MVCYTKAAMKQAMEVQKVICQEQSFVVGYEEFPEKEDVDSCETRLTLRYN
jgi:hypothetical protein